MWTKTGDTQRGRHRWQHWCEEVTPRPRGFSLVHIHPVRWRLLISSSQTCLRLFIYLVIYLSLLQHIRGSCALMATGSLYPPLASSITAFRPRMAAGSLRAAGHGRPSRLLRTRFALTPSTSSDKHHPPPSSKPSAMSKYSTWVLFLLLLWWGAGKGRGWRIGRRRRRQGV